MLKVQLIYTITLPIITVCAAWSLAHYTLDNANRRAAFVQQKRFESGDFDRLFKLLENPPRTVLTYEANRSKN
jgi:hypothetical protein